jgi:hypothetical protein
MTSDNPNPDALEEWREAERVVAAYRRARLVAEAAVLSTEDAEASAIAAVARARAAVDAAKAAEEPAVRTAETIQP